MKKSDLAMIVLIASVSMMIAYFVAHAIMGDASNESVKVKTVEKIDATVVPPDETVFNTNAINPTVEIIIGDSKQTSSR